MLHFLSLCILYIIHKHGLKPFDVCETRGKLKCVLNIQCWWRNTSYFILNSYKPTWAARQELMQEAADHFLVWENWGLCGAGDFRQRWCLCSCVSPWLRGSSPRSCQEAGSKSCHPDTQTPGPDKRLPSPSPRAGAITHHSQRIQMQGRHMVKQTKGLKHSNMNSPINQNTLKNHFSYSVIYI